MPPTPDPVLLREGAIETVALPPGLAAELARRRIADVAPWGDGLWRVSNVSRVGVVRLDGAEVRIAPKVPLRNLFALVARARSWEFWTPDTVALDEVDELHATIAQVFLAYAGRAVRSGVPRGYVERREAAVAIRGRVLVGEQLRRRHGLPLPVELQFDDYTADIPITRLLRSAGRRLLGSGALPARVRSGLLGIDRVLGEATLLARGAPLPEVAWDRRTERFRPAVGLAELVLTDGSLDHRVGTGAGRGFLLNVARVFEEFVDAEVRRAARAHGGWIVRHEKVGLDRDGRIELEPDLVWRDSRGVRAVLDAKYKAEKPAGFPNADIYQMLAYCVRHGVPAGHLVYAAGNESPARYVVEQAGVTIVCHALDLDVHDAQLTAQVDALVARIAADAVSTAAPA